MAQGGLDFSVKGDVAELVADLTEVQKKIVPRVTIQVLNRTGKKAETMAVGELSTKLAIPKGKIRHHFDGNRQRRGRRLVLDKAGKHQVIPEVGISWLPRSKEPSVKLVSLNARETRRGVTAGAHKVVGGFIAAPRGRRGGPQVWKRAGRARYPILLQEIKLQPSADNAFGKALRKTRPFFRKEFTRVLALRLRR